MAGSWFIDGIGVGELWVNPHRYTFQPGGNRGRSVCPQIMSKTGFINNIMLELERGSDQPLHVAVLPLHLIKFTFCTEKVPHSNVLKFFTRI